MQQVGHRHRRQEESEFGAIFKMAPRGEGKRRHECHEWSRWSEFLEGAGSGVHLLWARCWDMDEQCTAVASVLGGFSELDWGIGPWLAWRRMSSELLSGAQRESVRTEHTRMCDRAAPIHTLSASHRE